MSIINNFELTVLSELCALESLAIKKAALYGKLFTERTLAEKAENISKAHSLNLKAILKLL